MLYSACLSFPDLETEFFLFKELFNEYLLLLFLSSYIQTTKNLQIKALPPQNAVHSVLYSSGRKWLNRQPKELMSNWQCPMENYKHILQLSQLQNTVPSLPLKLGMILKCTMHTPC